MVHFEETVFFKISEKRFMTKIISTNLLVLISGGNLSVYQIKGVI